MRSVQNRDEATKRNFEPSSSGQARTETTEDATLTEAGISSTGTSSKTSSYNHEFPKLQTPSTETLSPESLNLNTKHQLPPKTSTLLLESSKGLKPTPSAYNVSVWKPDVYARTYVPEAFLAVNRSPATFVPSKDIEGINFHIYISTFAGSRFLHPFSPMPLPTIRSSDYAASLPETLNSEAYFRHFQDCLQVELEAQVVDCRSYDLFCARVGYHDVVTRLYSLEVPGLREGTPRIFLGDSVLLRQLRLDPTTMLPQLMNQWLAPGGGQQRGEPAPGFTGFQHCAVVWGIDKPREKLLLRIDGLIPESMVFNVSFLARLSLVQAMHRAVALIDQTLRESNERNNAQATGEVYQEDQDVESSIAPIGPSRLSQSGPGGPVCVESASACSEKPLSRNSPSGILQNRGQWMRCMLFPQETDGVSQTRLPIGHFKQDWFDSQLNYEQMKAVDAIQNGKHGNLPFLISGPPGTGKTKTIVEIALQLLNTGANCSHILLCAPSDPAADTLALRLRHYLAPSELFRLNASSRTFAEVPGELLPYCYTQNDLFMLPAFKVLMTFKIIVTTCRDADILVQARVTNQDLVMLERTLVETIHPLVSESSYRHALPALHWGAFLVDEAAQATEPELGIPLIVVAPPSNIEAERSPHFVMAGDEYQLGPRVSSRETTFGLSLFERLLNRPVYKSHPMARRSNNISVTAPMLPMLRPPFVNLIRNYRSHPAILAVPSALFYHDTLIPEAPALSNLYPWPGWRGRRWPVLFACNAGSDEVEYEGGGWYNIQEVVRACNYAYSLVASGLIAQEEICIMSPFRAQVSLLRKTIRVAPYALHAVNIGPTEAFQGLESRVVIVCTTRVRSRFLDDDKAKGLGIVGEAKRFNVALTRAKEGLIVIGNPYTLAVDPAWLAFMSFCYRNGLWDLDPNQKSKAGNDPTGPITTTEDSADVNIWAAPPSSQHPSSRLETALLYRDMHVHQDVGSKYSSATERFMSTREDDAMWVSGIAAAEEVLF